MIVMSHGPFTLSGVLCCHDFRRYPLGIIQQEHEKHESIKDFKRTTSFNQMNLFKTFKKQVLFLSLYQESI